MSSTVIAGTLNYSALGFFFPFWAQKKLVQKHYEGHFSSQLMFHDGAWWEHNLAMYYNYRGKEALWSMRMHSALDADVALPIKFNALAVSALLCFNLLAISWNFHQKKKATSDEICRKGLFEPSNVFAGSPISSMRCYWRMALLSSLTITQEIRPLVNFQSSESGLKSYINAFSLHIQLPLYWRRALWFTGLKSVLIKVALLLHRVWQGYTQFANSNLALLFLTTFCWTVPDLVTRGKMVIFQMEYWLYGAHLFSMSKCSWPRLSHCPSAHGYLEKIYGMILRHPLM